MLRRHRLLETFLVETLGLDWGEIHDEAEELEHAISEKVLEKLDEFLGRPSHDPHGDPIPTRRGTMPSASSRLCWIVKGDDVESSPFRIGKNSCEPQEKLTLVKKLKWCKTPNCRFRNLKFGVALLTLVQNGRENNCLFLSSSFHP